MNAAPFGAAVLGALLAAPALAQHEHHAPPPTPTRRASPHEHHAPPPTPTPGASPHEQHAAPHGTPTPAAGPHVPSAGVHEHAATPSRAPASENLFQSDMSLMAGMTPRDPMAAMTGPRWSLMVLGVARAG